MRIAYDLGIDDACALALHHYDCSPAVRGAVRGRRMILVCCAILIAIMGLSPSLFAEVFTIDLALTVTLLAIAVGVGFGGWFLAPPLWRRQHVRQVRRLYLTGKNEGVLGPQVLEIVGDDFVQTTSARQSRIRISALEKIEGNDDYAFVYTSTMQANIVPYASATEGDPVEFIEILSERFAAATGQKAPSDAIRRTRR
jgi:hypothetical protein